MAQEPTAPAVDDPAVTVVYESSPGERDARTVPVGDLDYANGHWRLSIDDDEVLRIPRERVYSIRTPDDWTGSFLRVVPTTIREPGVPQTTPNADAGVDAETNEETRHERPQIHGE